MPHLVGRPVLVVLLVLAGGLLVACDADAPAPSGNGPAPASLIGTTWRVVAVGDRAAIPSHEPTIAFQVGRIVGSGGCNSFGASYRSDPSGAIVLDQLAMTAMGCVDRSVTEFETLFAQALGQATQLGTDPAGRLVLAGAGGRMTLVPAGQPAATD